MVLDIPSFTICYEYRGEFSLPTSLMIVITYYYMMSQVNNQSIKFNDEPVIRSFRVANNLILLRSDIRILFLSNAFGIDVDVRYSLIASHVNEINAIIKDDYRVVTFEPLELSLPSHLPSQSIQSLKGSSDTFIRNHFRHFLRVNMVSGDIKDQYSIADVEAAYQDLGITRGYGPVLPFDDPKWQTPLGKVIFAGTMSATLDRSVALDPRFNCSDEEE